jgi:hypothetical protein
MKRKWRAILNVVMAVVYVAFLVAVALSNPPVPW